MKILSIDFDYFQNVDADTVTSCYPDGIDLPSVVSEITWASHYSVAYTNERLNKVGIREDELNMLYSILDIQRSDIPVMVSYTHRHIYDFVNELTDYDFSTRISMTNLDMHHDMFNDNEEVDCGNWVIHLMNTYPKYFHKWIANPISKEAYGFNEGENEFDELVSTSLKDIKGEKYDAIFICRSDNWLPPHLDNKFDELLSQIKHNFRNIKMQEGTLEPRTEYLNFAKCIAEQNKKFYDDIQKEKRKSKKEITLN